MGYKTVCFKCQKAFNLSPDLLARQKQSLACPECHEPAVRLSHRFRPPKRTDTRKWDVVRFLYEKGFVYEHIFDNVEFIKVSDYVEYPETMVAAREFVEKYASHSKLKRKPLI